MLNPLVRTLTGKTATLKKILNLDSQEIQREGQKLSLIFSKLDFDFYFSGEPGTTIFDKHSSSGSQSEKKKRKQC